jgi:hypothetical protein
MDGRSEAQGLNLKAQGLRPKAQEALHDSQLDRDIESAVGIDPSPEFLARVRTRIASEPVVEFGFSRIRRLSFAPLAAVAIAGIVLAVVVPHWMRDEIETIPDAAHTAAIDVDELVSRRTNSMAADVNVGPVRVVRRTGAGEIPLRLSPVLFSEEERRAVARLVMAVEEGLVPPPPETTQVNDQSGGMRELRIEPLIIEPLPHLARLEQIGALQ